MKIQREHKWAADYAPVSSEDVKKQKKLKQQRVCPAFCVVYTSFSFNKCDKSSKFSDFLW